MKSFAERLKAARARTTYTQEGVAEGIDVHHFTYSKWEQGLHEPKGPRDYEALGRFLDCSVAYLRGTEEEPGRYLADPAHDRTRRREVTRTPRARLSGAAEEGGGYRQDPTQASGPDPDWHLVVLCLRLLMAAGPEADDERLVRSLPLFYVMAQRDPSNCDATMARQILQAIG